MASLLLFVRARENAEALYDAEAVLSNPSTFKAEEIRTLRDQIVPNLERAWEITGGTEDQLTGTMVQISQVVAKQLSDKKLHAPRLVRAFFSILVRVQARK